MATVDDGERRTSMDDDGQRWTTTDGSGRATVGVGWRTSWGCWAASAMLEPCPPTALRAWSIVQTVVAAVAVADLRQVWGARRATAGRRLWTQTTPHRAPASDPPVGRRSQGHHDNDMNRGARPSITRCELSRTTKALTCHT